MDLNKLSSADKLIVGGGASYLICMFFPWYGLGGYSSNGWDYFLGGVLPLLLIAVMAAQVLLTALSPDTKLPDLPLPWKQVHLIAGVAAAVLVILRLLIRSSFLSVDLDRKFGLILAVFAAIVVAVGGFQKSGSDDSAAAGGSTGSAPF